MNAAANSDPAIAACIAALQRSLLQFDKNFSMSASQSARRNNQTGAVRHTLSTSKARPQPALQLKTVTALNNLGNKLAVRATNLS